MYQKRFLFFNEMHNEEVNVSIILNGIIMISVNILFQNILYFSNHNEGYVTYSDLLVPVLLRLYLIT